MQNNKFWKDNYDRYIYKKIFFASTFYFKTCYHKSINIYNFKQHIRISTSDFMISVKLKYK